MHIIIHDAIMYIQNGQSFKNALILNSKLKILNRSEC